MKTRLLYVLVPIFAITLFSGCGNSEKTSPKAVSENVSVTGNTTWKDTTVTIEGVLSLSEGTTLTMENVTLILNPEVEDSSSFTINNAHLIAINSSIRSGSEKQWNLEATGTSTLEFYNTTATDHTGIRAFDNTVLTARGSEIEEVQCHDNATLNILEGSAVYIALFFDNTGAVELNNGKLASGDAITRSFTFKSTAAAASAVCGHINIENSDVWGFQTDLIGSSDLTVGGGTGIVLALHLDSVGSLTISDNITSLTNGSLNFGTAATAGPKFTFSNTAIEYINVYVSGVSNVTFSGKVKVVEANVMEGAKLTFGSGTSLIADLAQAYDTATLTLNGTTLISDDSIPSFTAMDNAVININNVNALAETRVYAVGNGIVNISGGTGWDASMFEETDSGRIVYTSQQLLP